MNDFIVIAHTVFGLPPEIVLRTPNEECARAYAHKELRITSSDVQVFDLQTLQCVLALSPDPEDQP